MVGRVFAIIGIFVVATIAWMGLGASISTRSNDSDRDIREEVQSMWGAEQRQQAPAVQCTWIEKVLVEQPAATTTANVPAEKIMKWEDREHSMDIELTSSRIRADFDMDYRRKGLLWYSTYNVGFAGDYTWKYTGEKAGKCFVYFSFPTDRAVFDDFKMTSNGVLLDDFQPQGGALTQIVAVKPGQDNTLHISYKTRGLDRWYYSFGATTTDEGGQSHGVTRIRDFDFEMNTSFGNIDFPSGTISPTSKKKAGGGWLLGWKYKSLISGFEIGLEMPSKINPGPLASQISFFAPVSLFFFFLIIFVICLLRNIDLHPMNYIFLAAAFFSFHLLLAYLSDRLDIKPAFAVASVVSIFLVITYLRLVVGWRFSMLEAGISQLIYLVLFSYAHFLKGFTGLAITIISVATLFVLMQLTGRVNWSEKFKPAAKRPMPLQQNVPPPPPGKPEE